MAVTEQSSCVCLHIPNWTGASLQKRKLQPCLLCYPLDGVGEQKAREFREIILTNGRENSMQNDKMDGVCVQMPKKEEMSSENSTTDSSSSESSDAIMKKLMELYKERKNKKKKKKKDKKATKKKKKERKRGKVPSDEEDSPSSGDEHKRSTKYRKERTRERQQQSRRTGPRNIDFVKVPERLQHAVNRETGLPIYKSKYALDKNMFSDARRILRQLKIPLNEVKRENGVKSYEIEGVERSTQMYDYKKIFWILILMCWSQWYESTIVLCGNTRIVIPILALADKCRKEELTRETNEYLPLAREDVRRAANEVEEMAQDADGEKADAFKDLLKRIEEDSNILETTLNMGSYKFISTEAVTRRAEMNFFPRKYMNGKELTVEERNFLRNAAYGRYREYKQANKASQVTKIFLTEKEMVDSLQGHQVLVTEDENESDFETQADSGKIVDNQKCKILIRDLQMREVKMLRCRTKQKARLRKEERGPEPLVKRRLFESLPQRERRKVRKSKHPELPQDSRAKEITNEVIIMDHKGRPVVKQCFYGYYIIKEMSEMIGSNMTNSLIRQSDRLQKMILKKEEMNDIKRLVIEDLIEGFLLKIEKMKVATGESRRGRYNRKLYWKFNIVCK